MPDTQNIDLGFMDFVAHLVMTRRDAANLTRSELVEFVSDAWMLFETGRCGRQRLHEAGGGLLVDGR